MAGRLLAICIASGVLSFAGLELRLIIFIVVQLLFAKGEILCDVTKRTRVFTRFLVHCWYVAGGLPDVAGLACSANDFVDNVAVEHLRDL